MWQIPIYDRTAANVAEGADKCYLNAETLNRIEGNTAYMASLLGAKVSTRHWEATDFLTRSEMERILQNIQAVRDAYFVLPGTSDLPEEPTTCTQASMPWRKCCGACTSCGDETAYGDIPAKSAPGKR